MSKFVFMRCIDAALFAQPVTVIYYRSFSCLPVCSCHVCVCARVRCCTAGVGKLFQVRAQCGSVAVANPHRQVRFNPGS